MESCPVSSPVKLVGITHGRGWLRGDHQPLPLASALWAVRFRRDCLNPQDCCAGDWSKWTGWQTKATNCVSCSMACARLINAGTLAVIRIDMPVCVSRNTMRN